MIGWTHKYSDDFATAVINGQLDEDIDRLIKTLQDRKDVIKYGTCISCGEPIRGIHEHDGQVIMRKDTFHQQRGG